MATLDDGAKIVADSTFQRRVGVAVYFVAREVFFESSNTPNHELRARYAQGVLAQDLSVMLKYAALVVTSPGIASKPSSLLNSGQATISDSEIIAAVRDMWDPLSGVVS